MKKIFLGFFFIIIHACSLINVSFCNEFVLIIPLYNEKRNERIEEYQICLHRNLAHSLIKKIHVVYDSSDDDQENKILSYLQSLGIETTILEKRATYGDCFQVANEFYPKQSIILSNADIFFNDTLNALIDFDLTDKFLALTRWNVTAEGQLDLYWCCDAKGRFLPVSAATSQDVWIFKTPLRKFKDDIPIGTWHCDARIVLAATMNGLKLLNPCLTIQCCHLHLSGIKNYERILTGTKILGVPWCHLGKNENNTKFLRRLTRICQRRLRRRVKKGRQVLR